MKNTAVYVRDAFGGAMIVGIIWYFANAYTPENGKGWFERQTFPLNNMACCIAAGAALGALGTFSGNFARDRRRQAMQSAAMYNRLDFEPFLTKPQLGSARSLRLFDNWDEGRNLLHGRLRDVEISIFDLHKKIVTRTQSSSGSSSTTRRIQHTVFLFERPDSGGLTAQILRKGSLAFALTALNFRGVEFEPRDTVISDDDRRVLDDFNSTYLVAQGLTRGGTRTARAVMPDDELLAGLEQVVDLNVMRKLVAEHNWNVELGDTHIAIWKYKDRIRPSTISDVLPQILELHSGLSGASKQRSAVPLKALGTSIASREVSMGQMGWIAGSGCLGMLLAAGIFGPLFFMYADEYPWMVFAWPFFGMGVVIGTVKLALWIKRRAA
jgi:hypothetical protein